MKKIILILVLVLSAGFAFAADPQIPGPPPKPVPLVNQPGDERIVTVADHVTFGELRRALWAAEMLDSYYQYSLSMYNVAKDAVQQNRMLIDDKQLLVEQNLKLERNGKIKNVIMLTELGALLVGGALYTVK